MTQTNKDVTELYTSPQKIEPFAELPTQELPKFMHDVETLERIAANLVAAFINARESVEGDNE
jgi:hypothetical protein